MKRKYCVIVSAEIVENSTETDATSPVMLSYIERNPAIVKSITSFPYIVRSL